MLSQTIFQDPSMTFIYTAPTETKLKSWSLYKIYTGGKGMQCEAEDKIMHNTNITEKAEALNAFFTSVYQHCSAPGLGNKNPN